MSRESARTELGEPKSQPIRRYPLNARRVLLRKEANNLPERDLISIWLRDMKVDRRKFLYQRYPWPRGLKGREAEGKFL